MSEWRTYKIGDALKIRNGKSRPKIKGAYPVYGGNGILDYANEYNVEGESIIIGRVGAYCGSVFFENKRIWVSDNAMSAKSLDVSDPKFMFYLLKGKNLNKYARGSSHPLLTQGLLNQLEVSLPDLPSQRQIASILSSLDDKIELNLQMNQTLEKMAQAIFKEWFVDFNFPGSESEKRKGKSEKLKGKSEKGELPKGWTKTTLGDVLDVKNGYAFKSKDFTESGVPVIKIKNVKPLKMVMEKMSYVSRELADQKSRYRIKKNDILITMSGNRKSGTPETWTGKVALFNVEGEYLLNQRVSILEPLSNLEYLRYYLAILLSSEEMQFYFITNATSSGGQANISPTLIKSTEVVLPSEELLSSFNAAVIQIFEKITLNDKENHSLSQTRDTLLPKLMSGQLKVKK